MKNKIQRFSKGDFSLSLIHISITGELVLKEAEAAKWLRKDELDSVQWLPADLALIEKIGMRMEEGE